MVGAAQITLLGVLGPKTDGPPNLPASFWVGDPPNLILAGLFPGLGP